MDHIGLDISRVSTTPEFKLGTVISNLGTDGPYKEYKYVKYEAGAAAVSGVAGEVAYYYGASGAAGGYANNIVTSDLSDSNEIGAGVLVNDMADGEYGWVQITGPATLSIALAAETDGAALTPTGGADGTLDVSAAVTDHVCAITDDASAKSIVCMFPK